MRVSEVAKSLEIPADTVRYYTRIGLLQPQKSKANGYKEYSDREVGRLRFILSARQLGFSVVDIEKILAEANKKKSACQMVRRLIEQRLFETEQRFAETLRLQERMREAIKDWNTRPDKVPTGHEICHLIESFSVAS